MSFEDHRLDLCLALGKTFSQPLSFTNGNPVFKQIEAVTKAAPAELTVTAHGIPNGWPVLIESAQGMPGLNRPEAWQLEVVNANTLSIPGLNTFGYDDYVANSGVLLYSPPADLAGRTGVLSARASRNSSDVLFTLSDPAQILIEPSASRVTLQMTAAETTALIDTVGNLETLAYDLELPDASGKIDLWTWGDINILRDV